MRLAAGLMTSLLVLAGCRPSPGVSDEPTFSPTVTVLTGYRLHNWEYGHTMYALGLDGPICLDAGRKLSEVDEAKFAELRGHISARGRYGGMARCAYVYEVTEVVQDRDLPQSDRDVLSDLARVFAEPPPGETPGAQYELTRDE